MTGTGNSAHGDELRPPWWRYWGDGVPATDDDRVSLPDPPNWRAFHGAPSQPPPPQDEEETDRKLGRAGTEPRRRPRAHECDMVNSAIVLRRPLLVTGSPGTGKSSIAYRIARELHLGRVLQWPVTSRTTLRSGLYEYDAIGRAQATAGFYAARGQASQDSPGHPPDGDARKAGDAREAREAGDGRDAREADDAREPGIVDFVRLGALGTALLGYRRPRVLLVDELDKSDVDLPNDLLHVFEDGEFAIPELVRAARQQHPEVTVRTDDPDGVAVVRDGRVRCHAFPIVVITSNGEREFPPAFLRRCLRLELPPPDADELAAMVRAQLPALGDETRGLIDDFLVRTVNDSLARDQLLNAVYLTTSGAYAGDGEAWQRLIAAILQPLSLER
jgi:MoxR-like ATPase